MFKYIKVFDNHTDYMADKDNFDLPNTSYCIQENEVHYNPYVHDYSQDYLTFKALEDGTFTFTNPINYSIDGGTTWTELSANTATPNITSGNKIMWKGTLTPNSDTGIGTFSSTAQFNVEGNAMSLLYGDDFKGQTDLTEKNYAFYELFSYCANVVSAENMSLPATTLASGCYQYMFRGCRSLTTAPELPATTLANSCYDSMLSGCTSLTTAPELSATTLAENCYENMFNGCTSLTTAPTLPATTLANSCYYYMFVGCTSLTAAPELPATTLVDRCYNNMFQRCTSLNYIKCLATDNTSSRCTRDWVSGVASNGTFVKAASMEDFWQEGESGIPTGWTVETATA